MFLTTGLVLSAILLVLVAFICWALNIIGMPWNWLIVATAAIYSYLMPDERRLDVSVLTIVVLFVLAAIGEAERGAHRTRQNPSNLS